MNFLDLFFPKKCVGCSKLGGYICASCIENIFQKELICPFCKNYAMGGITHDWCIREHGLDGLWSLGSYEGVLKKALHKFKYNYVKEFGDVLSDLIIGYWAIYQPVLSDRIKKSGGKDWIVVPVPLHKHRQNRRGFNQSAVFAKLLADKLGLEFGNLLIRSKKTKAQVGLDAYARRKNIKGSITIVPNYTLYTKPYILLVDDVWTTGATMKECCYILKKSGVKQVWGLTVAR